MILKSLITKLFNKKLTASVLGIIFLLQQTMVLPVLASDITGITKPGGEHGSFDIHPEFNKGDIGFRHYYQFNLDQGDIANLIFKMQQSGVNIEQFVNLVDKTININGIINTMRDNNFYGGRAIFVSPNGMVVGASGVLNVGSLTAIAPAPNDYLRFAGATMGQGVLNDAANNLGVSSVIDIPGAGSFEDNMTRIEAADQKGDINIQGKIIARNDVSLKGKNIIIGQEGSINKAGIVAGVGANNMTNNHGNADQILTTNKQAENLFNALVNNDVVSGKGFGNENGKITIAAQSFRENSVVTVADKIGDKLIETIVQEAKEQGIDEAEAIQNAINDYLIEIGDVNDPDSIETNKATVTIHNATIAGEDVDITATSKIDYISLKGNPMVDFISGSAIGNKIQSMISGNDYDYEGARAKATIDIGSGAEIKATGDVNAKSLAIANTNVKLSSKKTPVTDTTGELYYSVGTKTVSNVNVKDGASIKADGDVTLNATSKNSQWIKIKNPTSVAGNIAAENGLLPTVQIIVLNSMTEADTNVNVENGAEIKAQNLDVQAVNTTNDLTTLNSLATIDKENKQGIGAAIAIAIKNSDINTSAKLDTTVDTHNKGNVNVTAQSMHVSSTQVTAKVDGELKGVKAQAIKKLAGSEAVKTQINNIISKLGLEGVTSLGESLPNVSTALVVNNSNIDTSATIGKNANIHADNVNVQANAIDLTVNSATSHVQDSSTADYVPAPGVAVIVNNQTNNTNAAVEDGDSNNHAVIKANNDFKISSTLEQPMNEATFEFILGLAQTAGDLKLGLGETADAVEGAPEYIGSGEWDYELLLQALTNPAGEITGDIKDIKFDLNAAGIKNTLGLKGFFNNWAESTSTVKSGGMGTAASVVVSEILNNTNAKLGNYTKVDAQNVIVNAANKVTQYNAVGDVAKLWKLTDGSSGDKGGIGGSVLVESVESKANAQIGDHAEITATAVTKDGKTQGGNVSVNAANNQNFLSVVVTGSKTKSGLALSGSTVVQDVTGETTASVGKSKINASTLTVNAGEAQSTESEKTAENLFDDKNNPFSDKFEDLDDSEVTLEADLSSPVINKYKDIDENTGLLSLKDSVIKDGISNILISGAIASQKDSGKEGGSSSSSGAAIGAAVNVSEFSRAVNAFIADGADITLTDSLNVIADSYTQSLNIAVAGAFAGGVSMKDKGDKDKNKADSWKDKANGLVEKLADKLNSSDNAIAGALGSTIKNNLNDTAAQEAADANKGGDLAGKLTDGGKLTNTENASTASNNMSAAAAGSVNIQINDSTVEAKVGNANITVGKDINVKANQKTSNLNVGTGFAKASTVGAGAAVNVIENTNKTNAIIGTTETQGKAYITFTGDAEHNLNVTAEENNDNIQVAVGVGVASNSSDDTDTTVSAGGSFNTDILENSVKAQINNASVKKTAGKDIDVNVNAKNYSTAYKGAGGLSINSGTSDSTSVGAGVAGNINLINKKTEASINANTTIEDAKNVKVAINNDKDTPTENLISVAVGGAVITGSKSGYSFEGAIGADVINNSLTAAINNSQITASENIDVIANNYLKDSNITGALAFSTTPSGVGAGLGTVVNVINTELNANITDSTIYSAEDLNVKANDKELLQFLAMNMGITTKGASTAGVNAIVNVLNSTVKANITNSDITNSGDTNVIADYDTDIKGITGVVEAAVKKGAALGGNALVNVLSSKVEAEIKNKKVDSDGKVTVSAKSNEKIDVVPIGVGISGGKAAAAGNIAVNVLNNKTNAKVDSTNIHSSGLSVEAEDTTTSYNRGGTLAITIGNEGAAIGGSVMVDVLNKNVNASIENSQDINTSDGAILVEAKAETLFGPKDTPSISLDGLIGELDSTDLNNIDSLKDWQMTYDLGGGGNAAVSGSLIAKFSDNKVTAGIKNSNIQNAGSVDVAAKNEIYTRAIVGNITGSKGAAIGGSTFINVNTGKTEALIDNSKITAADDVTVKADSVQDYKTIMAVGGGAGKVSVNGSINTNTAKDTTTASIKNSSVSTEGNVNVSAQAKDDVESMNLAVSIAGKASVGGIVYNNNFNNTVSASISGTHPDLSSNEVNIKANDITLDAKSAESFSAMMAMIGVGGNAAVSGVIVVNTIAANVNSFIENAMVNSDGKINVNSAHSYNYDKYGDKTNYFTDTLMANSAGKDITSDDITTGEYTPIVMVLGISGAGNAAINATDVTNVLNTNINAYVQDSQIASVDGLSINAVANEVFYDALAGVGVAGNAAVGVTTAQHILSSNVNAALKNTQVTEGNVDVTATQNTNLNTVLFMANIAGSGAGVTAVAGVNTLDNNVNAKIENSTVHNGNANVKAENNTKANTMVVAASGAGVGAAVNAVTITDVASGSTIASIENSTVKKGKTTVEAINRTDMNNLITGGAVAGQGAAIGAYAPVSTMENTVKAFIKDSHLNDNSDMSSVSALSEVLQKTIVANISAAGVGAGLGATAIVNVIDNDVEAYILNTDITNGSIAINAQQHSELEGMVASVAATGVGFSGGINTAVNTLEDRVKAYADNVIAQNAYLDIDASENQTLNFEIAALTGSGTAGGTGAAIVNVINNELNAYLQNSELTGGQADVNATLTSDITADMSSLTAGGLAGVGAGAVVNVLTNKTNAYIQNSAAENVKSLTASAVSNENIYGNNSVIGAGWFGAAVSTLVNVIENETTAKIDAGNNNITTTGALTVNASDTLTLNNEAGSISAGVIGAGASVNVNVLNNTVTSELLSNTGKIIADSANVTADSVIDLNINTNSTAGGVAGIAGTVAVTNIGDRITSDVNVDGANVQDSVAQAQDTVNGLGLADEISLTAGDSTQKQGTAAIVSADITTNNDINVKATNTVNADIYNKNITGGIVAAGATVLVTNTNYKTSASIDKDNASVSSQNGDISVIAKNNITATTEAKQGSGGLASINGNIALFKNNAQTSSEILSGTINALAGNVNINAESTDNITSIAHGEIGGGAVINVIVAQTETDNKTTAQIKGKNGKKVTINAKNLEITATNTSDLKAEMMSTAGGAFVANTVINEAVSKSDTTAGIFTPNGDITLTGDLTIAAQTDHIRVNDNVIVGSIAAVGAAVTDQNATIESKFTASTDSANIKTKNATIKAGTKKNSNEAGELTANVTSVNRSGQLVGGNGTNMNAVVSGETNVKLNNTTLKADEKVNLLSKIKRLAKTDSESLSAGLTAIGVTTVKTDVKGTTSIDTSSSTITAKELTANADSKSEAKTTLIAGNAGLASVGTTTSSASVATDVSIKTGNINADKINIDLKTEKSATIEDTNKAAGFAGIGASSISTNVSGKSGITTTGTIRNQANDGAATNLKMAVTDNSTAENKSKSGSYGAVGASVIDINSVVSSTVNNLIGGDIWADNIKFESNLNRTSVANGLSESAGIGGISKINITSRIGGESDKTGSTTTISANIGQAKGTVDIDSNTTNNVKTYLSDNVDGLIAIAKGSAKNILNSQNNINITGAIIDIDGNLAIDASNLNNVAMTRSSDTNGFIAIKGGTLENTINSEANIDIQDSTLKANIVEITSKAKFASLGTIQYDDSAGGFITSSGAKIDNKITQKNNVNFKNSTLNAKKDLSIKQQSDSDFHQAVKSTHSGFAVYNRAESNLTVTNENKLDIDKNTEITANNITIAMDSSNNLSSETHTEARHFAGQPKSFANLTLNANNTMNTSGKIVSKGSTNIQFLSNSINTLKQDAYLYAEAAVATGDTGGSLNYNTDNKLNIEKGAIIASDKDVVVNYDKGINKFDSKVHYKKKSRLLFGIPITKSDSWSSINTSHKGSLKNDGEVSAGIGSQKYMTIDKDGNIVKDSLKGFIDSDYQVQDAVNKDSATVTQETLDALTSEKDYLQAKIEELNQDKNKNSEQIKIYNDQIAEIDSILDSYESAIKYSEDQVNNMMNNAIKDKVVGLEGPDGSSLSSSDYEAIKNLQSEKVSKAEEQYKKDGNLQNYLEAVENALDKALAEYQYSYEKQVEVDGKTETQTITTNLTDSQKSSIKQAVNDQQALYKEDANGVLRYGDAVVMNQETQNTLNSLNQNKESIDSMKNSLLDVNSKYDSQISSINGQINDINTQYDYISKNPLPGINIAAPSIVFDSIIAEVPKIKITGITESDVTGDGTFKLYQPSLVIENYSNKNLIFSDININRGGEGGLTIGGKDFSDYLDTNKKINNKVAYVTDQSNAGYQNTVTINSYFDKYNPEVYGQKPSDTIFNSTINAGKHLNIFNDGGDITFANAITADKKTITATNGNIVYDAAGTNFELNSQDSVKAGKNVTVTAKNIKVDGTLQAGTDERNIEITDEMLLADNLVVDPATGLKNMIKTNGNIKALYKDGKIYVFHIAQEGGNVDFNGSVTGSGKVTYTNGYSTINIQNDTEKQLIVQNLANNRMNGSFDNQGTITNVVKLGKDKAETTISSNADVIIKGVVENGKGFIENDDTSVLTINANKAGSVIVENLVSQTGLQQSTVDSFGILNINKENNSDGGIVVNGKITHEGDSNFVNNGNNGVLIAGVIDNSNGTASIESNNGNITVSGTVSNNNGAVNIENKNTEDSYINITSTGVVKNTSGGNISIRNNGKAGLLVEGIINSLKDEIMLYSDNSDIIIGHEDTDNNILADNNNINITINNGNLLNAGFDKTLINTGKDLNINITDGDIGKSTHALAGKENGFSINASTRDNTEAVNIKVDGKITASAKNNNKTNDRLINLNAKKSGMNVNKIDADGNVMLTAAEWPEKDENPTPDRESYFHGYSIINAADDKSQPNITGKNISIIASDNVGSKDNALTYLQTQGGSISVEAENDLYIKGMGSNDNIWQLITKRGNMGLDFSGDAVIRELTAGKDISIVSKGSNVTIYDLGKVSHLLDGDDLLFPHDQIKFSDVVPETVHITVLDVNPETRIDPDEANATINIYNAYVKGKNNGKADVVLKADKIIAHAYDAADSIVTNTERPNGFDPTEGRLYADDYTDKNAPQELKATGFNTVGEGSSLVFDIQGVSPDDVKAAGADESSRNYKPQDVIQTVEIFNNPFGFTETVYKAKDVTLSLNSSDTAPDTNRGMVLDKFYADNAYVDTKDLNLKIKDGFITNYAEFRNGDRFAVGGGRPVEPGEYRWLTIVDNDYNRNISSEFGIPVTSQLYTKLTGSFALSMGNLIALETKAPVVNYNPYEVVNLPRTENSFYRLTYKDDKIQKTTTTPEFSDIDKSTYKPTKRNAIRFNIAQKDGYVLVSDKKKNKEKSPIISIIDISKTGLAVEHDGTLKVGDRMVLDLNIHNIKASPEVEVVRVSGNNAGMKFINLDKATANKILYMNMYSAKETEPSVSKL